MKLIKQLIILFILLFLTYISAVFCVARSATIQEQVEVLEEGRKICKFFLVDCHMDIQVDDRVYAQTIGGKKIQTSTKLGEILNKDEYRSVVYHEVGHAVLRHTNRAILYLDLSEKTNSFNKENWYRLRRSHEYEADMFSKIASKVLGKPVKLSEALKKIVPKELWNRTSNTHPSVNDRVRRID